MPTLLYKPMNVGIDLAESFEESVTKDKADKFYILFSLDWLNSLNLMSFLLSLTCVRFQRIV